MFFFYTKHIQIDVDASELRRLYREASCLLQPGVEDFGMTVVEALACNCPIVALGRGGVLDIVESGRHGVLYDKADSAEALGSAIDKFQELRSNFMDLRRRAEQFSTEKFQSRVRTMLDHLARNGDTPGL